MVYGVMLVALGLIPFLLRPGEGVSIEECIDAWNDPANAPRRALVSTEGFRLGYVEVLFSQERYEGCAFTFGDSVGRGPWIRFSSSRIPGSERRLRWHPKMAGEGNGNHLSLEALYRLEPLVGDDGNLEPD